jgi:F-type H+-transporting ATPase subunit alpha
MSVEKQVAVLYCGTNGLLSGVPIDKVQEFEKQFLMVLELSHKAEVLDVLKTGTINDAVIAIIEKTAAEVAKRLSVN